MGEQPKMSESKGWQQQLRQARRLRDGRERRIGSARQTEGERRVLLLGDTSNSHIERKTIHIGRAVRPESEPVDCGDVLNRQHAGGAFTWWAVQSAAEREATIAGVIAANEVIVTKMKESEAANRRRKRKSPS